MQATQQSETRSSRTTEHNTRISVSGECIAVSCADCMTETCVGKSCGRVNRMLVRYVYSFLFLLSLLVAWMIRDYSDKILSKFPIGTQKSGDFRDLWHTGWWPAKCMLWILFMVVPFFMPPTSIKFYGEVARFGGGIFLVVQLLAVLNFIYWWNESWLSDKNVQQCQMPMLCVSLGCFVVSILGVTMMFIWYAPHAYCGLNIFLITWSLILIQVMTSISLHSKVNAGLLTSGLMSLYIIFLGWSALMSEPVSATCNSKPRLNGRGDWITVLGFLLGIFTLILASFSTSIEPRSISFQKDEDETSEKLPYGYGFFHFVFCLGAMYFAMLFIGWDLEQTMEKWNIDYGWSTVWIKVINQWLAACFYVWTMIGPLILKHRDFS
ncbi:hypothetical protein KP509_33G042300 [Ceratopteris richardii]|uniref:Serine incorporator n=1 Tax=Ceratopteris richardii TaxID=49495 RepID=A0A8T2QQ71_CERRI|nr:hypothetical protein KP509_33G042300 [Ceratopteris richardii]